MEDLSGEALAKTDGKWKVVVVGRLVVVVGG